MEYEYGMQFYDDTDDSLNCVRLCVRMPCVGWARQTAGCTKKIELIWEPVPGKIHTATVNVNTSILYNIQYND